MRKKLKLEFTNRIKETVYARGVCEECGCGFDKDDPWEVHHIIWIQFGLEIGIPHAVLKSLANARLLHRSCHHSLHNNLTEPEKKDVDSVLNLFNKQTKLF